MYRAYSDLSKKHIKKAKSCLVFATINKFILFKLTC